MDVYDDEIIEYACGVKCYKSTIPEGVWNRTIQNLNNFGQLYYEHDHEKYFHYLFNSRDMSNEQGFVPNIGSDFKENATFIDIGSAWGYYCFLVKRLMPNMNIVAYDMDEGACESFDRNKGLNSTDATVHNEKIYFKGDNEGRTLREVIDSTEEEIGLMKIDVSGDAVDILKGAGKSIRKASNIVIGTSDNEEHTWSIYELRRQDMDIILNIPPYATLYQPNGLIAAACPPEANN